MKNKILSILVTIVLVSGLFLLTGCGNQEEENVETTENTSNVENNTESSTVEDGIEVGDNFLKFGTYEGKDLAEGSTIILNSDMTFEYQDDENTGSGTYEVSEDTLEIEPNEPISVWIIEFDSIIDISKNKIPENRYMLFSQTGDISAEEASLNFDYVEEDLDMTNADDVSTALDKAQIDTFNAKFEQYEGEQAGVKVKALLTTINSSNASDTENTVTVEYNGEEMSSSSDISGLSSRIASGMTYNVTLEYENELVSKVIIENN